MLERVGQLREQALEQIQQYSQQSEQDQSRLRVTAVENETTGNSVRLARQVYAAAEARQAHVTFKNLDAAVRQSQRQAASMHAQSQSQLNRLRPAPMQPISPQNPIAPTMQPSWGPYLLQAGSSVVNAWAFNQQLAAQTPPTGGSN